MTKEKKIKMRKLFGIMLTIILTIVVAVTLHIVRKDSREQDRQHNYLAELDEGDKELAHIYAALYDLSDNEVAKYKQEKKDWHKVNELLEKEFFTISGQVRYDMVQAGYDAEDLAEAEVLSKKTGKKAIDLARKKGKAGERGWSDVVKEAEIKSVEEQLGLTREQIAELKREKYSESDRIEIALLCVNGKMSFTEIMNKRKTGKSMKELKEEIRNEKE